MSNTPDAPAPSLAELVEGLVDAAFDAGWHVGSVPHAQTCAAAKAALLSAIARLEAERDEAHARGKAEGIAEEYLRCRDVLLAEAKVESIAG